MWDFDDATAQLVLGAWIARWRRQAGVSQRALAWRAGVDQGGLSRAERGLEGLGSRRLARLVMVLDVLCNQGPMGSMPPPPVIDRRAQRTDGDALEWSE
jgi:transcriptional regulator with XRE-family HTH domain